MSEHKTSIPNAPVGESSTPGRIAWQWCAFNELSLSDLYTVLHLRQVVFVLEQACLYLDVDGYDERAWHLLGWTEQEEGGKTLAAYARIFAPGIKYEEASIGRVVTHPALRRRGMGEALMAEALRRVEMLCGPGAAVRIGAQLYLERFYEKSGFRRVSEPYDDDGVIHIEMLRAPRNERS
jgi:ElaA protein